MDDEDERWENLVKRLEVTIQNGVAKAFGA
jgi:hypothetical protein